MGQHTHRDTEYVRTAKGEEEGRNTDVDRHLNFDRGEVGIPETHIEQYSWYYHEVRLSKAVVWVLVYETRVGVPRFVRAFATIFSVSNTIYLRRNQKEQEDIWYSSRCVWYVWHWNVFLFYFILACLFSTSYIVRSTYFVLPGTRYFFCLA